MDRAERLFVKMAQQVAEENKNTLKTRYNNTAQANEVPGGVTVSKSVKGGHQQGFMEAGIDSKATNRLLNPDYSKYLPKGLSSMNTMNTYTGKGMYNQEDAGRTKYMNYLRSKGLKPGTGVSKQNNPGLFEDLEKNIKSSGGTPIYYDKDKDFIWANNASNKSPQNLA